MFSSVLVSMESARLSEVNIWNKIVNHWPPSSPLATLSYGQFRFDMIRRFSLLFALPPSQCEPSSPSWVHFRHSSSSPSFLNNGLLRSFVVRLYRFYSITLLNFTFSWMCYLDRIRSSGVYFNSPRTGLFVQSHSARGYGRIQPPLLYVIIPYLYVFGFGARLALGLMFQKYALPQHGEPWTWLDHLAVWCIRCIDFYPVSFRINDCLLRLMWCVLHCLFRLPMLFAFDSVRLRWMAVLLVDSQPDAVIQPKHLSIDLRLHDEFVF